MSPIRGTSGIAHGTFGGNHVTAYRHPRTNPNPNPQPAARPAFLSVPRIAPLRNMWERPGIHPLTRTLSARGTRTNGTHRASASPFPDTDPRSPDCSCLSQPSGSSLRQCGGPPMTHLSAADHVVLAAPSFGRDGAMFQSLLEFVAQLSLVLWSVVIITVLIRFVG